MLFLQSRCCNSFQPLDESPAPSLGGHRANIGFMSRNFLSKICILLLLLDCFQFFGRCISQTEFFDYEVFDHQILLEHCQLTPPGIKYSLSVIIVFLFRLPMQRLNNNFCWSWDLKIFYGRFCIQDIMIISRFKIKAPLGPF